MPIVELPIVCDGIEDGIRITKGASKTISASLNRDLTGATAAVTVKRSPTAIDILLVKPITILPPASDGKIQISFVGSDTSAISAGIYTFTLDTTLGSQTTEIIRGKFFLEPFDQSFVGKLEPILNLSINGATERISIEIRDQNGILADPAELDFTLLDFSDNVINSIASVYPDYDPRFTHPEAGIFMFDFMSNRAGDFLAIWTYRFTGEEPTKVIKNIRYVTPAMWFMIPEIRLYIDKARKASNKPIAFNPQDVAVYIENSLRDFNATPPTTSLKLENISSEYKEVLVQGAIIQSLVAQGLLAVDQDFQYNDNGISLSIDHSAKLQSWYTTILNTYIAKKRLYKMNFFQPSVYGRTIIGQAWALALSKAPSGSLSRFRGWI